MSQSQTKLVGRILKSIFYSSARSRASKLSTSSPRILELLKQVLGKTQNLGKGEVFNGFKKKILLFVRMLKSYANGSYRHISTKNLVTIVAGFLYFVSPIDLVPDFLPLIGFVDDIALITFITNSLAEELEKFELWEMNNIEV